MSSAISSTDSKQKKNAKSGEWKKSACILCSINCGIEVQTGGQDNREIVKVRGDKDHPNSQGYVCEKTKRLAFYQSGKDRISQPQRRRADGTYESISWDVAISEIAEKFNDIKARHGGDKIMYYGGGGQGNHLGGTYGDSTVKALGIKYRSNALAQEKTGEFWVNGKMLAAAVHGDFEHSEVSVFIGKNPWQSHGFSRARVVIREIEKDPKRKMIVIDPRVSETAAKADYHLALKPGSDAWCLAALVAILIQEDLIKKDWIEKHTQGYQEIEGYFQKLDIALYAQICGLEESDLRQVASLIAQAESVSVFEDLGLQMNHNSTLGSYLQRFLWLLTGNFARKGCSNAFVPFVAITAANKGDVGAKKISAASKPKKYKTSPVTQSKIITGLMPCNVIPEEILSDHPDRFRAMLIESANPVHSLADSPAMRKALRALELSVVIDVAMTETARQADYVLPAASQYEKGECSYFTLEFPDNAFHFRPALFEPLAGTLPEAEIHSRLVEAMGAVSASEIFVAKTAAKLGKPALVAALGVLAAKNKKLLDYMPVVLYRALGSKLKKGSEDAAVLWGLSHMFVQANAKTAAAAGFGGNKILAGEKLFKAIINNHSGVVFSSTKKYEESWDRIKIAGGKINLYIPEMFDMLKGLSTDCLELPDGYSFVLSAGERRSDTSNTIVRNPAVNKKTNAGSLRINPDDAAELGVDDGDSVKLSTAKASTEVVIEFAEIMRRGHVSLPNGFGLEYEQDNGEIISKGISTNELTDALARDPIAGTPWHKFVPARIEALA